MSDRFSSLVGQDTAVRQLKAALERPVHAYIFVGPSGVGKRAAALAFAAELLNDERALTERHPDVVVVEREGAAINVAQAREISRLSSLTPVEGNRKVLILVDFHLVDEAAPAMLKTIEEATPSTTFVVLAESIPKELVTIASRCVRIDFCSVPVSLIERTLTSEGVDSARSAQAARGAFGSLDRARLLATDESFAARRRLWESIPSRLDGSGHAVAIAVDEIVEAIDHALSPLLGRQERECDVLEEQLKNLGQSPSSALKNLEARHKREQRRLRTDELRSGLAVLAQVVSVGHQDISDTHMTSTLTEQLNALTRANESLVYNPNEVLLLQGLLIGLSRGAGKLVDAQR